MNELTMGSLFDGIAGFPLASTYAQIRPVWSSEVEPFPIRVATKHFPDMLHFGDINAMNGAELPPVDIITGGFPCQSVSVAGRREGLKHISQGDEITTRSGLFYEAVRIIKEMRNATDGKYLRFFVGENVPGIFSSGGGFDYKNVLEALCQIKTPEVSIPRPPEGKWTPAGLILGEGFSLGWRVLDAAREVTLPNLRFVKVSSPRANRLALQASRLWWGVAQRRRRVFIVVDFGGQCAGKILFESEGCSGYTPPRFDTRKGTAEYSSDSVGTSGRNQVIADSYQPSVENEPFTQHILNNQGGGRMDVTNEQTTTLRTKSGGHEPLVLSGGFCMEHSAASRGIGFEEERAPTLRAGVVPGVALDFNPTDSRIGIKDGNICPTICSRAGTGGNCTPLTLTAKGALRYFIRQE